ncbi:MAG TPA: PAS domain S-box protein [Gemmatales bacterium]|nr:PAS domain S-box protein [Gemmatales bacterium]
MGLFTTIVLRNKQQQHTARSLIQHLQSQTEDRDHLVTPIQRLSTSGDVMEVVIYQLAERLCKRREQLRSTIDKLNEIMTCVSINKPIEYRAEDFDIPDSDDRTVLLGTLGQLITILKQSRQRGDVFAKVLRESPIAMMITGPKLEIRSMNPAAEKLLGCTQQKVLFRSFTDFFVAPPMKEIEGHFKGIVLPGMQALAELKKGKQEVFTTIRSKDGVLKLIGLRASFGSNCFFVLRERSRERQEARAKVADNTMAMKQNLLHPAPATSPASEPIVG